jgi:hypothetical protein
VLAPERFGRVGRGQGQLPTLAQRPALSSSTAIFEDRVLSLFLNNDAWYKAGSASDNFLEKRGLHCCLAQAATTAEFIKKHFKT